MNEKNIFEDARAGFKRVADRERSFSLTEAEQEKGAGRRKNKGPCKKGGPGFGLGGGRGMGTGRTEAVGSTLAMIFEGIDAILEIDDEGPGVPRDPYLRAKKRMDDAAKRGGIEKMIAATLQRVKAAKEPGKLQGIIEYVDEIIKQLEQVRKAAEAKL